MKNHGEMATALVRILIVGLFLMGLLVAGPGISCQSLAPSPVPPQAPAPPETNPELPEVPNPGVSPSENWLADGIIDNQEYLGEMSYGDYEIHWVNDAHYIYAAMKARTTGWVALGIQPGSKMKDADMILGFVKDGEVAIFDLFSTGDFGPHSTDTEIGGTFNIAGSGGKEEDGYTVIEFKRALDTGDQRDNKLTGGKNEIIWSYGSVDELATKHTNRGYGEITLTE
jgi:hypothetical protein